ncbi:MAG: queuosine precursor transporter [Spirochaetota bacterium]
MPNELLWVIMLLGNFAVILVLYRAFGPVGLIAWMAVSGILANIQVVKTIEIFGLTATLGNIVYASSFLATDILSDKYGKGPARVSVFTGFTTLIAGTLIMSLALVFEPAGSDSTQGALETIFTVLPRITLASVAAYLVSQLHDVWAFQFWKQRFPGLRGLWIRNNLSTMVSQLVDTVIFTTIAFAGVFPLTIFLEIALTTYVLKWLVAALDTPFVYIANSITPGTLGQVFVSAVSGGESSGVSRGRQGSQGSENFHE